MGIRNRMKDRMKEKESIIRKVSKTVRDKEYQLFRTKITNCLNSRKQIKKNILREVKYNKPYITKVNGKTYMKGLFYQNKPYKLVFANNYIKCKYHNKTLIYEAYVKIK